MMMPLATYGILRSGGPSVGVIKGGNLYYAPHKGHPVWMPAIPGKDWSPVHVDILNLNSAADLERYDKFESIPSLFVRNTIVITLHTGEEINAWIYVGGNNFMAMALKGEMELIPSGDWLNLEGN